MNYVSQAQTPKPAALLGALTIPLGVGALLAAGLAVPFVIPEPGEDLITYDVPIDIPPPPTETEAPERVVESPAATQSATEVIVPQPEITLSDRAPITTGDFSFPDIVIHTPGSGAGIAPIPTPTPKAKPIAVLPKGDPGSWIRESDYRTRWINEGLTGVASFSLEISASGRVTECLITKSTGHAVLDGATCRLLERRARFKPARDASGEKVTGAYNSSISWEIPD